MVTVLHNHLEAVTANIHPIHPSCTILYLFQPCVVVKQLTLDIEHYLGETVRTKAEWGHRYMSFTDYDVQILEVGLYVSTRTRLYDYGLV